MNELSVDETTRELPRKIESPLTRKQSNNHNPADVQMDASPNPAQPESPTTLGPVGESAPHAAVDQSTKEKSKRYLSLPAEHTKHDDSQSKSGESCAHWKYTEYGRYQRRTYSFPQTSRPYRLYSFPRSERVRLACARCAASRPYKQGTRSGDVIGLKGSRSLTLLTGLFDWVKGFFSRPTSQAAQTEDPAWLQLERVRTSPAPSSVVPDLSSQVDISIEYNERSPSVPSTNSETSPTFRTALQTSTRNKLTETATPYYTPNGRTKSAPEPYETTQEERDMELGRTALTLTSMNSGPSIKTASNPSPIVNAFTGNPQVNSVGVTDDDKKNDGLPTPEDYITLTHGVPAHGLHTLKSQETTNSSELAVTKIRTVKHWSTKEESDSLLGLHWTTRNNAIQSVDSTVSTKYQQGSTSENEAQEDNPEMHSTRRSVLATSADPGPVNDKRDAELPTRGNAPEHVEQIAQDNECDDFKHVIQPANKLTPVEQVSCSEVSGANQATLGSQLSEKFSPESRLDFGSQLTRKELVEVESYPPKDLQSEVLTEMNLLPGDVQDVEIHQEVKIDEITDGLIQIETEVRVTSPMGHTYCDSPTQVRSDGIAHDELHESPKAQVHTKVNVIKPHPNDGVTETTVTVSPKARTRQDLYTTEHSKLPEDHKTDPIAPPLPVPPTTTPEHMTPEPDSTRQQLGTGEEILGIDHLSEMDDVSRSVEEEKQRVDGSYNHLKVRQNTDQVETITGQQRVENIALKGESEPLAMSTNVKSTAADDLEEAEKVPCDKKASHASLDDVIDPDKLDKGVVSLAETAMTKEIHSPGRDTEHPTAAVTRAHRLNDQSAILPEAVRSPRTSPFEETARSTSPRSVDNEMVQSIPETEEKQQVRATTFAQVASDTKATEIEQSNTDPQVINKIQQIEDSLTVKDPVSLPAEDHVNTQALEKNYDATPTETSLGERSHSSRFKMVVKSTMQMSPPQISERVAGNDANVIIQTNGKTEQCLTDTSDITESIEGKSELVTSEKVSKDIGTSVPNEIEKQAQRNTNLGASVPNKKNEVQQASLTKPPESSESEIRPATPNTEKQEQKHSDPISTDLMTTPQVVSPFKVGTKTGTITSEAGTDLLSNTTQSEVKYKHQSCTEKESQIERSVSMLPQQGSVISAVSRSLMNEEDRAWEVSDSNYVIEWTREGTTSPNVRFRGKRDQNFELGTQNLTSEGQTADATLSVEENLQKTILNHVPRELREQPMRRKSKEFSDTEDLERLELIHSTQTRLSSSMSAYFTAMSSIPELPQPGTRSIESEIQLDSDEFNQMEKQDGESENETPKPSRRSPHEQSVAETSRPEQVKNAVNVSQGTTQHANEVPVDNTNSLHKSKSNEAEQPQHEFETQDDSRNMVLHVAPSQAQALIVDEQIRIARDEEIKAVDQFPKTSIAQRVDNQGVQKERDIEPTTIQALSGLKDETSAVFSTRDAVDNVMEPKSFDEDSKVTYQWTHQWIVTVNDKKHTENWTFEEKFQNNMDGKQPGTGQIMEAHTTFEVQPMEVEEEIQIGDVYVNLEGYSTISKALKSEKEEKRVPANGATNAASGKQSEFTTIINEGVSIGNADTKMSENPKIIEENTQKDDSVTPASIKLYRSMKLDDFRGRKLGWSSELSVGTGSQVGSCQSLPNLADTGDVIQDTHYHRFTKQMRLFPESKNFDRPRSMTERPTSPFEWSLSSTMFGQFTNRTVSSDSALPTSPAGQKMAQCSDTPVRIHRTKPYIDPLNHNVAQGRSNSNVPPGGSTDPTRGQNTLVKKSPQDGKIVTVDGKTYLLDSPTDPMSVAESESMAMAKSLTSTVLSRVVQRLSEGAPVIETDETQMDGQPGDGELLSVGRVANVTSEGNVHIAVSVNIRDQAKSPLTVTMETSPEDTLQATLTIHSQHTEDKRTQYRMDSPSSFTLTTNVKMNAPNAIREPTLSYGVVSASTHLSVGQDTEPTAHPAGSSYANNMTILEAQQDQLKGTLEFQAESCLVVGSQGISKTPEVALPGGPVGASPQHKIGAETNCTDEGSAKVSDEKPKTRQEGEMRPESHSPISTDGTQTRWLKAGNLDILTRTSLILSPSPPSWDEQGARSPSPCGHKFIQLKQEFRLTRAGSPTAMDQTVKRIPAKTEAGDLSKTATPSHKAMRSDYEKEGAIPSPSDEVVETIGPSHFTSPDESVPQEGSKLTSEAQLTKELETTGELLDISPSAEAKVKAQYPIATDQTIAEPEETGPISMPLGGSEVEVSPLVGTTMESREAVSPTTDEAVTAAQIGMSKTTEVLTESTGEKIIEEDASVEAPTQVKMEELENGELVVMFEREEKELKEIRTEAVPTKDLGEAAIHVPADQRVGEYQKDITAAQASEKARETVPTEETQVQGVLQVTQQELLKPSDSIKKLTTPSTDTQKLSSPVEELKRSESHEGHVEQGPAMVAGKSLQIELGQESKSPPRAGSNAAMIVPENVDIEAVRTNETVALTPMGIGSLEIADLKKAPSQQSEEPPEAGVVKSEVEDKISGYQVEFETSEQRKHDTETEVREPLKPEMLDGIAELTEHPLSASQAKIDGSEAKATEQKLIDTTEQIENAQEPDADKPTERPVSATVVSEARKATSDVVAPEQQIADRSEPAEEAQIPEAEATTERSVSPLEAPGALAHSTDAKLAEQSIVDRTEPSGKAEVQPTDTTIGGITSPMDGSQALMTTGADAQIGELERAQTRTSEKDRSIAAEVTMTASETVIKPDLAESTIKADVPAEAAEQARDDRQEPLSPDPTAISPEVTIGRPVSSGVMSPDITMKPEEELSAQLGLQQREISNEQVERAADVALTQVTGTTQSPELQAQVKQTEGVVGEQQVEEKEGSPTNYVTTLQMQLSERIPTSDQFLDRAIGAETMQLTASAGETAQAGEDMKHPEETILAMQANAAAGQPEQERQPQSASSPITGEQVETGSEIADGQQLQVEPPIQQTLSETGRVEDATAGPVELEVITENEAQRQVIGSSLIETEATSPVGTQQQPGESHLASEAIEEKSIGEAEISQPQMQDSFRLAGIEEDVQRLASPLSPSEMETTEQLSLARQTGEKTSTRMEVTVMVKGGTATALSSHTEGKSSIIIETEVRSRGTPSAVEITIERNKVPERQVSELEPLGLSSPVQEYTVPGTERRDGGTEEVSVVIDSAAAEAQMGEKSDTLNDLQATEKQAGVEQEQTGRVARRDDQTMGLTVDGEDGVISLAEYRTTPHAAEENMGDEGRAMIAGLKPVDFHDPQSTEKDENMAEGEAEQLVEHAKPTLSSKEQPGDRSGGTALQAVTPEFGQAHVSETTKADAEQLLKELLQLDEQDAPSTLQLEMAKRIMDARDSVRGQLIIQAKELKDRTSDVDQARLDSVMSLTESVQSVIDEAKAEFVDQIRSEMLQRQDEQMTMLAEDGVVKQEEIPEIEVHVISDREEPGERPKKPTLEDALRSGREEESVHSVEPSAPQGTRRKATSEEVVENPLAAPLSTSAAVADILRKVMQTDPPPTPEDWIKIAADIASLKDVDRTQLIRKIDTMKQDAHLSTEQLRNINTAESLIERATTFIADAKTGFLEDLKARSEQDALEAKEAALRKFDVRKVEETGEPTDFSSLPEEQQRRIQLLAQSVPGLAMLTPEEREILARETRRKLEEERDTLSPEELAEIVHLLEMIELAEQLTPEEIQERYGPLATDTGAPSDVEQTVDQLLKILAMSSEERQELIKQLSERLGQAIHNLDDKTLENAWDLLKLVRQIEEMSPEERAALLEDAQKRMKDISKQVPSDGIILSDEDSRRTYDLETPQITDKMATLNVPSLQESRAKRIPNGKKASRLRPGRMSGTRPTYGSSAMYAYEAWKHKGLRRMLDILDGLILQTIEYVKAHPIKKKEE